MNRNARPYSPHRLRPLAVAVFAALPMIIPPLAARAADGIEDLGTLGGTDSWANGVSADGSVVVGMALTTDNAAYHAFRWVQGATGGVSGNPQMYDLGTLGGPYSSANGISANGSVVVGESYTTGGAMAHAFRWVKGATGGVPGNPQMYDLGTLGGPDSVAYGVSADGKVVVGESDTGSETHAFRWVQGATGGVLSNPQMYDLGTLGGTYSSAYGVSADGRVVVGKAYTGGETHAFRWVQGATGGVLSNPQMYDLGTLGGIFSSAHGVSADGSVVVGESVTTDGKMHAFRWVQDATGGVPGNRQMYDLGTLGGTDSWVNGVSADGSVVVGRAQTTDDAAWRAFRWTQATGMQSVEDWLRAAGVTVPTDITYEARATNADGSVVVGQLDNGHAFIARVAPAGSGLVTRQDVQDSLAGTADGGGMMLRKTNSLVWNGAHSRPLTRRVAAGQKTFWLAGDWGRDDHGARNGDLGLAEVGVGKNFGAAQANVSLGQTWAKQHWTLNSRAKADGAYLLAEAFVPLSGRLWGVLGGYRHWGNADIRRGYLNAGIQDHSVGKPDVDTWGLRGRLEWEQAWQAAQASFSPYADLTYSETRLAAYSETGGGFPARFDARKERATELRLGVNAERPLAGAATLVGVLEAAHRFEKRGAHTSGELIGLFGFDLAGQKNKRDWLRAGIGVQGTLGEGRASLMLNLTTEGQTPNAWLAANWQKAF